MRAEPWGERPLLNGQGGKTEREQSEETHASLLLLLLLLLSGTDPAVLTISQVLDWNKSFTDQSPSLLDFFFVNFW